MTKVQIIHQLETLIEDAESHRNSDGTLDDVFQNDIEALGIGITAVKALRDEIREVLPVLTVGLILIVIVAIATAFVAASTDDE